MVACLLAKTLVHDPKVMLLDEPGANLDPKARITYVTSSETGDQEKPFLSPPCPHRT